MPPLVRDTSSLSSSDSSLLPMPLRLLLEVLLLEEESAFNPLTGGKAAAAKLSRGGAIAEGPHLRLCPLAPWRLPASLVGLRQEEVEQGARRAGRRKARHSTQAAASLAQGVPHREPGGRGLSCAGASALQQAPIPLSAARPGPGTPLGCCCEPWQVLE